MECGVAPGWGCPASSRASNVALAVSMWSSAVTPDLPWWALLYGLCMISTFGRTSRMTSRIMTAASG